MSLEPCITRLREGLMQQFPSLRREIWCPRGSYFLDSFRRAFAELGGASLSALPMPFRVLSFSIGLFEQDTKRSPRRRFYHAKHVHDEVSRSEKVSGLNSPRFAAVAWRDTWQPQCC